MATVRLTGDGPGLLLAEHLESDQPIPVFRVDDLDAAIADLEGREVALRSQFEMPSGVGIEVNGPGT